MTVRQVFFQWDDMFGECYECGRPAAYRLIGWSEPLCSVCTAQQVYLGEVIEEYLFDEGISI